MRREFKGGAGQYNLNTILGPNFKQFVTALDGSTDYSRFLVSAQGAAQPAGAAGQVPRPTDINYPFSEYLIAAEAAFRQIENPNVTRAITTGTYSRNVQSMLNELASGQPTTGAFNPPLSEFGFDQLPFEFLNTGLKHLVKGYHLLPYDPKVYVNHNVANNNAFVNAVRYLYHFIALLDTTNLNPEDVVVFLAQDNLVFNQYISELIKTFRNTGFFITPSNVQLPENADNIIMDAIYSGFVGVAQDIIQEFNQLDRSGGNANITRSIPFDVTNVNFKNNGGPTSAGSRQEYFSKLGGALGAAAATIDAALDALKNPLAKGGEAANAVPDADRLNKYAIDSLLNPQYILNTDIAKTISSPAPIPAPRGPPAPSGPPSRGRWDPRYWMGYGGARSKGLVVGKPGAPTATGGKIISLSFLYGPPLANGSRNLADNKVQGVSGAVDTANGNLVDPTKVALVEKLDANNNITGGIVNAILQAGTNEGMDDARRAVVLAILYYMITTGKDFSTLDANDKTNLNQLIEQSLREFPKVYNRTRRILTDNASIKKFANSFLGEFLRQTAPNFEFNPTTNQLGVRQTTPVTAKPSAKTNLADPDIFNFYKQVVADDTWYERFFNLLGPGGAQVALNAAKNITDANQLAQYRLNVKKNSGGYARFTGGQYGGVGGHGVPGDIILIDLLPDATSGNPRPTGMWLTNRAYVAFPANVDPDAIRAIARAVYLSDPTQDTITVPTPDGQTITLPLVDIARRAGISGRFAENYAAYFNTVLLGLLRSVPPAPLTIAWKRNEQMFSEYILRQASKWERVTDEETGDDLFVKLDNKGNPEAIKPDDNCAFIGKNVNECLDFLTSCLSSTSKTLDESCGNLLNFDFDIAPGMASLKEKITNINPAVAFKILQQFKFGSYLTEETKDPFKGFRRYKVQSVGSWLREMRTTDPRNCEYQAPAAGQCNPEPLCKQLGDFCQILLGMADKKSKFFDYLDMLVQWVNANPQVLNPEENKRTFAMGNYPNPNKSFETYSYRNPYKRIDLRLRDTCYGLERLKSSILNNLTGANGASMVANVTSVPLGYEMPLNRSSWTSPLPIGPSIPMLGGHGLYDLDNSLQDLNGQNGFEMFSQIYQDLLGTMGSLSGRRTVKSVPIAATTTQPVPGFNVRLTPETQNKVTDLLEKFKQTEEQLRDSLVNLIKRNKLYQASRGYIDPFTQNNDEFESILKKHSNLLKLSYAYNKKAINLIDVYQTITKTILEKLEELNKNKSNYERPLNPGYHLEGGANDNYLNNYNNSGNRNSVNGDWNNTGYNGNNTGGQNYYNNNNNNFDQLNDFDSRDDNSMNNYDNNYGGRSNNYGSRNNSNYNNNNINSYNNNSNLNNNLNSYNNNTNLNNNSNLNNNNNFNNNNNYNNNNPFQNTLNNLSNLGNSIYDNLRNLNTKGGKSNSKDYDSETSEWDTE